jgi:hypothetical protein
MEQELDVLYNHLALGAIMLKPENGVGEEYFLRLSDLLTTEMYSLQCC